MNDLKRAGYESISVTSRLIRFIFRKTHVWAYRTRYSRFCIKCGANEDLYGLSYNKAAWWERMMPERTRPEQCWDNDNSNG